MKGPLKGSIRVLGFRVKASCNQDSFKGPMRATIIIGVSFKGPMRGTIRIEVSVLYRLFVFRVFRFSVLAFGIHDSAL